MYTKTQAFYKLKNYDQTVTDSEQRLTDEMRSFALNTSEILTDVVQPLTDIGWYSVLLRRMLGVRRLACVSQRRRRRRFHVAFAGEQARKGAREGWR